MDNKDKSKPQLLEELQALRRRVAQLEKDLAAAPQGEVTPDDDKLLQDVSRLAKIGAWSYDPSTNETKWTDEVARIFDIEPGCRATTTQGFSFFFGINRKKMDQAFNQAIAHGTPYDLDLEMVSSKGIHKWVRTICHPAIKDGQVVQLQGSFQDITEHKRIEESLRLTQFIFDKAPIGIWRISKNGNILDVNEHGYSSLGYSREELCKMRVFDFAPDLSLQKWTDGITALDKQGLNIVESQHQRKNGDIFPIQVIENLLEFRGEKFHIAFVQDISERKRAEESLRLARSIIDSANIGIYRIAPDGKIKEVNQKTADLLGYTKEELEAMSVTDIDLQLTENTWNFHWHALKVKSFKAHERTHCRKDGSLIPVDVYSNLMSYEGQEYAVAFVQDITKRKQSEIQLKESESRYRSLIEHAPVGIVIVDSEGMIIDANHSYAAMLGYKINEIQSLTIAEITHPEDMETEETLVAAVANNEKALFSLEKRYRHKQGHYFWGNVTIAKVCDIYGPGIFYLGFVEDISTRKKLEQDRNNLIEKLQKALVEIKELRGIFPICSKCKKIRDDSGYWQQVEKYIMDRTDAQFSHSYCPDCYEVELEKLNKS